jgi:hypothetical protein
MKFKYFVITILMAGSYVAHSQTWRSAYYPTTWTNPVTKNFYTDAFLQDYSFAGYHRGEIAIPSPSSKIFDVTKAPYSADKTGIKDATTAIQNAINDAQTNNGGIVYLPAGTYSVNPGSSSYCLHITSSNIVLKGDGKSKTFILNTSYSMNSKSIISVSGSANWTTIPTSKALLTADIMNPVSVLPIDNPSLFKVGDLIVVRNEINDAWITEHKEPDWLGYGSNFGGLMYCRYITAIDLTKKTITIDVPVRYALKTRDNSCVYKISGMISEVGLQDFSIGNKQHPGTTGWAEDDYTTTGTSAYDCSFSYVIKYNKTINSWMKNISTYKPSTNTTGAHMLSNGILVSYCKNVTIDSCSMSYAQYGGGGGNGYAYRVNSNEVLISNSTASYIRHGFVFSNMCCSGNVFHKCKDIKTGFQCGNTGAMTTSGWGSDHHMHFSQSNLIDECYSENSAYCAFYRPYGGAPLHDLTATHTTYWNISSGGTKGFCVWTQQSRYGYAIGTSGTSSAVYTKENSTGSAVKTDPVDIVEGQGNGATLQPQSLYLDQLSKRLPQKITQTIQLQKGWNLISTNVCPTDSSITTLFATLDVQEIKSTNTFWRKGQNVALNSLQKIATGEGYLVKMNIAGTLNVVGTPVETRLIASLQTGWNLVGCTYQTVTSISSLFNTTNSKLVKNLDGFWIPGGSNNSITTLGPGKGYFIKK